MTPLYNKTPSYLPYMVGVGALLLLVAALTGGMEVMMTGAAILAMVAGSVLLAQKGEAPVSTATGPEAQDLRYWEYSDAADYLEQVADDFYNVEQCNHVQMCRLGGLCFERAEVAQEPEQDWQYQETEWGIVAEEGGEQESYEPVAPGINFLDAWQGNPIQNGELSLVVGAVVEEGQANPEKWVTVKVPTDTHIMLVGPTGSGKSVAARNLVYQCLLPTLSADSHESILIAASDITGVTFNPKLYDGLPCLFGGKVATTPGDTVDLLRGLKAEMDRRAELYNQLEGVYPEKLAEYNQAVRPEQRLPIIMCFIEEGSALVDMAKKAVLPVLTSLVWLSRKYGIIFVFMGQCVTKELIGPMRDSLQARFHFKQPPPSTIKMLEFPDKAVLSSNEPGRAIFKVGDNVGELQGLYVDKVDIINAIGLIRGDDEAPEEMDDLGIMVANVVVELRQSGVYEPTAAQVRNVLGHQYTVGEIAARMTQLSEVAA